MQSNWGATGKGTKGLTHPDRKVSRTVGIISSCHCDAKNGVLSLIKGVPDLTVSMTELVTIRSIHYREIDDRYPKERACYVEIE